MFELDWSTSFGLVGSVALIAATMVKLFPNANNNSAVKKSVEDLSAKMADFEKRLVILEHSQPPFKEAVADLKKDVSVLSKKFDDLTQLIFQWLKERG